MAEMMVAWKVVLSADMMDAWWAVKKVGLMAVLLVGSTVASMADWRVASMVP